MPATSARAGWTDRGRELQRSPASTEAYSRTLQPRRGLACTPRPSNSIMITLVAIRPLLRGTARAGSTGLSRHRSTNERWATRPAHTWQPASQDPALRNAADLETTMKGGPLLPEILGFSGFSWRPPTVISGRSYQPAWAVTASPIASLPMIGRHRHTSNKLPGHCTRRRPLIGGVRNPV